jgi:hypothetical protein
LRTGPSDAEKAFLHDVTRASAAVAALASARLSKLLPAKERRRAVAFARKRALSCMEELFCGPGDPKRSFAETLCIGADWTVVDRVRLLKLNTAAKSVSSADPEVASDGEVEQPVPPGHRRVLLGSPSPSTDRELSRVLKRMTDLLGDALPVVSAPANASITQCLRVIRHGMPNLRAATDTVARHVRLASSVGGPARFPPILLLGPPGVGKTRWSTEIAAALGLPYRVLRFAGASDARHLCGTARGWATPQPSGAIRAMAELGVANPMLIADEIDKTAHGSRNGSPLDALLTLLERENASRWFDECLDVEVDLSLVTWVLTANRVDHIPTALLDRVRVVTVPRLGPEAFDSVLSGMCNDIASELNVDPRMLPELSPHSRQILEGDWRRHLSLRRLRRMLPLLLEAELVNKEPALPN